MSDYTPPGVLIEEITVRPRSIDGVETSTAAFIGPTLSSPGEQLREPVKSFGDFTRQFGDLDEVSIGGTLRTNHVAYAARAFFENGGRKLYVLRVESEAGIAEYRAALERSHEFADIA
ncbi:MAG TPA: hypothetical protein VIT67_18085, partial [Povalibacter sp.]